MNYADLNRSWLPSTTGYSEAWERVLSRLGDYVQTIARSLNLRPTEVVWFGQTNQHLLVRLSTAANYFVLRIAPETDLINEVFFGRLMNQAGLPAARLIHHDLRRTLVPFDYLLEGYVCGSSAAQLDPEAHQLYAVAHRTGQVLRQIHRIKVGGWGRPNAQGRWPQPDWPTVLEQLQVDFAPLSVATLLFSETEQQAVANLLSEPLLADVQPCLLHGAPGPQVVRLTQGEHVHLEALVNPGRVVAGDGLIDLALALSPVYPQAWRSGVLDGYSRMIPLTGAEHTRIERLQIITGYWMACRAYAAAEPHEAIHQQTLALLETYQTVSAERLPITPNVD